MDSRSNIQHQLQGLRGETVGLVYVFENDALIIIVFETIAFSIETIARARETIALIRVHF